MWWISQYGAVALSAVSGARTPKLCRSPRPEREWMGRLSRRLLRHHLPLGLATCASALLLYRTQASSDIIQRLSFASAYPALVLTSVTLLIGPLKLISQKR